MHPGAAFLLDQVGTSEDGRTEGGVDVVWPVGWDVTAGAALGGGGCAFSKAGGGGSMLGL